MKKLLFLPMILVILYFILNDYPKVREVFNSNAGFDDLSRTIEVSISQNPAAAMVFGMEKREAVEVFNAQTVQE